MSTEHDPLATWDEEHLLHPWSFDGPSLMIVKGQGSLYWDADGREYIDALGSIQLCEVGHGRTELAEVAAAQMSQLEFSPLFWNFVNEPAARLAHRLAELAPEKLTHTFFTNDGSESCETAIKTVRNYHHVRGEGSRQTILSLRRAYHGMTYGALAASGIEGMKQGFGDLPPNFVQLSTPYPFRAEFPDQGAGPVDYCLRELEDVIEHVGPKNIAAFIGEPVLTVGGVIVPPDEYWPKVAEVCREHGILMVAG
jgi:putrescine aminotransferase